MHIIIAVNTYPEHFDKFEGWLKSKNVLVREVRLYDLIVPKETEKELTLALGSLPRSRFAIFLERLGHIFRWMLSLKKFEKIQPQKFTERGWWAYAAILGKVEDGRTKDGVEML